MKKKNCIAGQRKSVPRFAVVSESEVKAVFEGSRHGVSPYRDAINLLITEEDGKVVRFDCPRARERLMSWSKVMGVELVYADGDGGVVFAKLKHKFSPRELVLDIIKDNPMGWSRSQLVQEIKGERKLAIDVDEALKTLEAVGMIRPQPGGKYIAKVQG